MNNRKNWQTNWQREREGAFLYGALVKLARTEPVQEIFAQMAEQENQHAVIWADHIQQEYPDIKEPGIDLRIRLTLLVARMFGAEAVIGLLLNDEVSDIAAYSSQAMAGEDKPTYAQVLRDETSHARSLVKLGSSRKEQREPWHRGVGASGILRDMIYGFNDGLTANFGLVMGVVGASVSSQLVLLAGFAGLLADALSMAASGFLASRSEQEVRQYHLALEKAELELMPAEEHDELANYYASKGLSAKEANSVADRLMANPEAALTQLARGELGIDPEEKVEPFNEGLRTGVATALGAILPLLPFLFFSGQVAVWTGITISMAAHFLVGASRAIFTGRPALRSGVEMFLVGMGVAIATYLLGLALKVNFQVGI